MKIHIISAALPPQLDGIGDYTACLAAELARTQDITVLAGAPTPDPIPGVCIETVFSAHDPASVRGIADFVKTNPPDWVLLQYNPFSYGKWGRNLYLPRIMQRIQRTCPQTRFALMVHEPFVPIITPQFAVMATWQRWQLWRLGQTADIVFFSIDPWVKKFQRWFPSKPVAHLPVGSNIPRVPISREEARARLGIRAETIVLGLFGTMSAGRMLCLVRDAALALTRSGLPVQVLYVGPHQAQVCAALSGVGVIADGSAPTAEVSRRFAAMDIYLVPYSDGISTRRTTLMTALQHGIATVGTRGLLTDDLLEQENGHAFLLTDVTDPPAFCTAVRKLAESADLRQDLGENAQKLYERAFTCETLARKMPAELVESNEWKAKRALNMDQSNIKQQIKQLLFFIAPKAAASWQEVRRRRHIHRFEQRIGLPELTQDFITQHGQCVLGGPFAGMKYVAQAAGTALMPKLLGSYEAELHGVIDQITAMDYAVIIDIGCAEGYYANGLALRLPSAHVYAFDIDPKAQVLCREMAQMNSVDDQVTIFGECRHSDLNMLLASRALIVCDCEGYEAELLQPALVPAMMQADILVEFHEEVKPGVTSLMLSRFRGTHDVVLLAAVQRNTEEYPKLRFSEPKKRRIAISEFRPANQQWAFFSAKPFSKSEA